MKKGRTNNYFHGINKFCINNKISETNFPLNYKKNKLNLELDIKNITKGGEKTSQMSSKEKRLKLLENNVNNIKSIPNELMNDLEEEVFKILDEEFEKNHSNDNNKTKEEEKEKVEYELKDKKNEKEEKNIINKNEEPQIDIISSSKNVEKDKNKNEEISKEKKEIKFQIKYRKCNKR